MLLMWLLLLLFRRASAGEVGLGDPRGEDVVFCVKSSAFLLADAAADADRRDSPTQTGLCDAKWYSERKSSPHPEQNDLAGAEAEESSPVGRW